MGKNIDLRVRRLERRLPTGPDLSSYTWEELLERLFETQRQVIADPASPPEAVRRAERLMALPWGTPCSEWPTEDFYFFSDEARRHD
jgi:hypothetical protein